MMKAYLNKSPRHLHRDGNLLRPILCEDNLQLNFQCRNNGHRPAKSDHFQHQSAQSPEHEQRKEIPVGDKLRQHPPYPRHHHKQFPTCHCGISPLFLLLSSFRRPVLILKRTKTIGQHENLINLIFLRCSFLSA